MNKFTKLVFIVILFVSGNASASFLEKVKEQVRQTEMSVFVGTYSKHWISQNYTNSSHNMLGVRVGPVAFGRFDNSYDRESYFLAYYHDFGTYDDFNFFGALGLVRGYTICYGEDGSSTNTCPLISGGVSYVGFGEQLQPALFQLGDASVLGLKSDF